MELGRLITKYRKEANLTLDELAARSGVPKGTINKIISGATRAPTLENIRAIAYALDKTLDDFDDSPRSRSAVLPEPALDLARRYSLLDEAGQGAVRAILDYESGRMHAQPPAPAEKPPAKIIPLFGNSFAAGVPEPDFGNQWEDYEVPYDTKADFAIRINGDSMEPYLHDGSVALGRRGQPSIGEVGAFLLDGEFLCKQYCQDHLGNIYLFSLNRQRRDTDVTIWHDVERSLFCFGRILLDKPVPLPTR